jgi:hypothetical protein
MGVMLPKPTEREVWQQAASLTFSDFVLLLWNQKPYQGKDLSGIVCLARTKQRTPKEVKHEA